MAYARHREQRSGVSGGVSVKEGQGGRTVLNDGDGNGGNKRRWGKIK